MFIYIYIYMYIIYMYVIYIYVCYIYIYILENNQQHGNRWDKTLRYDLITIM